MSSPTKMATKKTKSSAKDEKKRAAQEAKIAGWRTDLLNGTPKKRVAAARKLADVDPEGTRETLLTELDNAKTKTAKKTAVACLHQVADIHVARQIATEDKLELQPQVLSTAILATLYDDLRKDLPKITAGTAKRRIEKLDLFNDIARFQKIEDEERWETAYTNLLLAILDEEKVRSLHQSAARMIRDRDDKEGFRGLVARWEKRPEVAHGFDVLACWLRVTEDPPTDALMRAVCKDLVEKGHAGGSARAAFLVDQGNDEEEEDDFYLDDEDDDDEPRKNLDDQLAAAIDRLPEKHLRPLVAALVNAADSWPAFADAVAKRFAAVTNDIDALVAILDDATLSVAHAHAATRIAQSGREGARLVIERARRLDPSVIKKALQKMNAGESFELLDRAITEEVARNETELQEVILSVPSALRDARWLEAAKGLPNAGRDFLIVMARDPKNPCRTKAVDQLAQEVKRVSGRMEKRAAVYALGQTGHPHATLFLVDALDDPDLADGAPLICTALAEVGDTRAIPILEKRKKAGKYAAFLDQAIRSIRARVSRIHADVLLAATADEDPVIADLARRAQEGDEDSAIVLEDALRDRGRL